jgi:hypothetical protein
MYICIVSQIGSSLLFFSLLSPLLMGTSTVSLY